MDAAEVNKHIEHARELMDQSVEHLQKELVKISTGKASTSMLDGIFVDYPGYSTLGKEHVGADRKGNF